MSLFITSLNSGSNGNCYYVGNENEAVLVDAGIPCGEIEKRMNRLGLTPKKVKAIFVSHEHTDHISGVQAFSKKYLVKVFVTQATHRFSRMNLPKYMITSFTAHEPVIIGNLSIIAFPKLHDAADPYSFVVSCNNVNVGVFTDIGRACENLIHHFKKCHAAFLETNYDDTMLEQGSYPYFLKSCIRGDKGHLSNIQALRLFTEHKSSFMSHLILSHLSKNNNCAKLVLDLFNKQRAGVKVTVASRDIETPVYQILNSTISSLTNFKPGMPQQLSFTFA